MAPLTVLVPIILCYHTVFFKSTLYFTMSTGYMVLFFYNCMLKLYCIIHTVPSQIHKAKATVVLLFMRVCYLSSWVTSTQNALGFGRQIRTSNTRSLTHQKTILLVAISRHTLCDHPNILQTLWKKILDFPVKQYGCTV